MSSGSYYPTRPGDYLYQGNWYISGWPQPASTTLDAPSSRFQVVPLADTPAPLSLRAGRGEFYLMDQTRHFHVAPAQYPGNWTLLGTEPARVGEVAFHASAAGLRYHGEAGLLAADPGPHLLIEAVEEPEITPEQPFVFYSFYNTSLKPGLTYRLYGDGYNALPNTGLLLPRFFGEPANAPRRAHTLHKIIEYYGSGGALALGTLHPETPGYAPGTQVLFKCVDFGVTWTFTLLPATGRWHDIAATYLGGPVTPVHNQIVLVGDDGIYTSMGAEGPWKHIQTNTTAENSAPLTLRYPASKTDLPLQESIPLELRSVTWEHDRFIAAGVAKDGNGDPVYVEGVSTFWFAYPLAGWPADRSVDEIAASGERRLLLSRESETGAPALLATNQPLFAPEDQGTPPTLAGPTFAQPQIGTGNPIRLTQTGTTTRYIIEGDVPALNAWHVWDGHLYSPGTVSFSGSLHRYHLSQDPIHLRITPVNEFGRGETLEMEVRPTLPLHSPFTYGAPRLETKRTVKAVFGAPLFIPIKNMDSKAHWWTAKVWCYGLPEGLAYDPTQTALVGHALTPGTHVIRIMTINERGAGWAEPLTLTVAAPSPKPIDSGVFTGLLEGAPELAGSWTVTLKSDRSFTGKLVLPGASHPFKGKLSAVPDLADTFTTTVSIKRKGKPTLELDLVLHATDGRLSLDALAGDKTAATTGATVGNRPWAKDRLAPRVGEYTVAIRADADLADSPVSVGQGFARIKINALGQTTLRGELANGIKWTASVPLSGDGALPLYWKTSGGRSLHGLLAFDPESTVSTALRGQLNWLTKTAEKCPAYGDAATLTVGGDIAPVRQPYYGALLSYGKHSLLISHEELARFGFPEGALTAIFAIYDPKLRFGAYPEDANPASVSLKFNATTKLATGEFTAVDASGRKPVKRVFSLRGAAVKDPDTGQIHAVGYFLFPSTDGKIRLSGKLHSQLTNN